MTTTTTDPTTTDQPILSADAICPSWCASDHEEIGTHRSESVAVVRKPSASGEVVTRVHLAQYSLDSRPRIYINGRPHTPDAADLVARAIIRLETHLHAPAVGAALDAGDGPERGPGIPGSARGWGLEA